MEIKKISILDGFTAVRNDLDWREFEKIAEVEAYDRTPPELVLERQGMPTRFLQTKFC